MHVSREQLDHALIMRLRTSYALVRAHELRLAEIFYRKLFAEAPYLRQLFQTDPQVQARKLITSLDTIVEHLAEPQKNAAMLAALGRRHVNYGAKPEHYDHVIELLVESMRELLGVQAESYAQSSQREVQRGMRSYRMEVRRLHLRRSAKPETYRHSVKAQVSSNLPGSTYFVRLRIGAWRI